MQDNDTIREWLKNVTNKLLLSEVGRRNNAARKTYSGGRNGGRPKILKPCPKCGLQLGVCEMVKHHC